MFIPNLPKPIRWIAHPADRINVAMALAAPPLLFAPFFVAVPGLYVAAYGIALFLFFGKSNYLLHLHIHRPFCCIRLLNLLVELALGAVTAMVSSNWRIQHLYGHHRGIDMPYRGDRSWELEKYSPARALSYSAGSIWGTFYGPYKESFRKGILANVRTPINYRWAFIEHTLLAVFVAALFVWQPTLVLIYLLPWYFVTHFVTRYVDYLNHYGCDEHSSNPYVRANNSLDAEFNSSTHNFGYHTAHHIRPGAHWTELPEIHRKIADKIPKNCLKPVSWSGLLLPTISFFRASAACSAAVRGRWVTGASIYPH
jgi:fatty acid desaturase